MAPKKAKPSAKQLEQRVQDLEKELEDTKREADRQKRVSILVAFWSFYEPLLPGHVSEPDATIWREDSAGTNNGDSPLG